MPDLYCGDCGYPARDLSGCALCQGPVFDLSTPQGVSDCRTYRDLRGEQTQKGTNAYVAVFAWLAVMALSFVVLYASGNSLGDLGACEQSLALGVTFLGSGAVWAYYRWTRLPKERVLDDRLERPDPCHAPRAPEPARSAGRPSMGARA
jgi:hypothetical protein